MYDASQIKNGVFETTTVGGHLGAFGKADEINLRTSQKFDFFEIFFEKFWVYFLIR